MPGMATIEHQPATIQFQQTQTKVLRVLQTAKQQKKYVNGKSFMLFSVFFLWIWNEFDKVIVYYIGKISVENKGIRIHTNLHSIQ